jgi:hypothetical protein
MADDLEKEVSPNGIPLRGAKGQIIRALRTLSGIPTPDGEHPTGRHHSLLRTKMGGAIAALTGLITAYVFILKPIEEAKHTGVLHQSPFGIIISALLLSGGIAQLFVDLRDEKSVYIGDDGRLWWTRRSRIVMYSMWGSCAWAVVVWYLYVRGLGLNPR